MLPTIQAKAAAALFGAALFTLAGFWLGHRYDLGTIATLRATLAQQQAADAQAMAKANAIAAAQLSAAQLAASTAVLAAQTQADAGQAKGQAIETRIAVQAAQQGQDGPVAPVLSDALAQLEGVK
ncbi:MAG TPA: hypothetical protein VMH92_03970 [Acidocella sp.]|nr:hypothetical protein [Acidocella sp.]